MEWFPAIGKSSNLLTISLPLFIRITSAFSLLGLVISDLSETIVLKTERKSSRFKQLIFKRAIFTEILAFLDVTKVLSSYSVCSSYFAMQIAKYRNSKHISYSGFVLSV
jgi:hypothetical protein